jgi:predicted ester cyclase
MIVLQSIRSETNPKGAGMADETRSGDRSESPKPGAEAFGTDASSEVLRGFWDAVNARDLDQLASLVADEYTNFGTVTNGPEMIRKWASSRREAFPDLRFEVRQELVAGDWIVQRLLATGTFRGKWHEHGLDDVLPTGRRHEVTQIHMFRIADGKIAEHWAARDDLGMLRQLGVLPDRFPARPKEKLES